MKFKGDLVKTVLHNENVCLENTLLVVIINVFLAILCLEMYFLENFIF